MESSQSIAREKGDEKRNGNTKKRNSQPTSHKVRGFLRKGKARKLIIYYHIH